MTRPRPKRQRRLDKDASIGIVGCGIAGLSTAISLLQAGFTNVTIFERDLDPTSRREGFGMTLTYNPQGPLAHCGVLEQVAQQDCPSRSHYVFDPDGKVLGYYGNAFLPRRGFGQRGNMRIPRQVLQKIMTERFMDLARQQQHDGSCSSIRWGHSLTGIRENIELGMVELEFQHCCHQQQSNTTSSLAVICDLVIAADGVRSSVVSMIAPQCQPCPLKVMLILGIAEGFHHPLLTERGFYTVGDGKHRLFTMPYAGDRYTKHRRIMWQLSYRYDDMNVDEEKNDLGSDCRDPKQLIETALNRCSTWHEPVPSLIRATPLGTVWGTPLFDRDPSELLRAFQSFSRIVVVGDALHAMSPFKGQGANQALLDGPLVADWVQRARVEAAVKGIWREAVSRTDKVVRASREAAVFWHSTACTPGHGEDTINFAGVREDDCVNLMETLSQRRISAHMSGELDASIGRVIEELGVGVEHRLAEPDAKCYSEILEVASRGGTAELRNLSLTKAVEIRLARDEQGRSCLHVAAKAGHFQTCRWLLTEAMVDPWAVDSAGTMAPDETSDPRIQSLFQTVMQAGLP